MRSALVGMTVLVATVAASCGGGDTGHAPPMLSSTLPRPPAATHANHPPGMVVLCAGLPETATTQPVVVPGVVDLSLPGAVHNLVCEGFRPIIDPAGSVAGVVISQTPPAGATSAPDRAVRITVRRLR